LYAPVDYSGSFNGPVLVRYALANSLNVPAVRVLCALGPDELLQRLHDLGYGRLTEPASYYGLGLTLGGGEVSLWESVRSYLTMARAGNAIPLRLLPADPLETHQIGDPDTWRLVTDMLADPHARIHSFGRNSVLDLPFPAAVKTGTSSDFRDTWTVGFSRTYTVGVWVGNFDGSAMRGVSGVAGAGPLWNRIMLHLHERNEPLRFDPPRGFVRTSICATTGHTPSASCHAIVWEWARPAQLAAIRRPVAAAGLHIDSPVDGSIFYLVPPANALQVHEEQLTLRASGTSEPIRWYLDGTRIATDAAGTAFFALRLGTFHIEARTNTQRQAATVRVVQQPAAIHPGFSAASLK
jgi:penicillin-binding protein 1C